MVERFTAATARPGPDASGWAEGLRGEEWDLPLTSLSLTTTTPLTVGWMNQLTVAHWQLVSWGRGPLTNQWLSRTTNGHSLTVGHLGEGPTDQPMTEQDHQQSRTTVGRLGEGPTDQPITEQDHQRSLTDSWSLGGVAHRPTNDWAGPPTVTHWQLVTWGRGPLTNQWLSRTTNGHSLTVGRLGEGSTAVPTNGWARPPTVTHWQLVAWGRGPIWHQPRAE